VKPIDPEDIDGLIAALQVHLQEGRVGFDGLFSRHQMNFKNCWRELCQTISDVINGSDANFDNEELTVIRNRMNELADTVPYDHLVYAVNTTFYGKDTALQDHAPKR